MFVALQPLSESSRAGPPIQHAPGDVLERWAEWPYRVRVALLHAEMAEERPDVVPVAPPAPDAAFEPVARDVVDGSDTAPQPGATHFPCTVCGREDFASASALKRHVTRKHT